MSPGLLTKKGGAHYIGNVRDKVKSPSQGLLPEINKRSIPKATMMNKHRRS